MKKLKSLVLSFALAAGGAIGLGQTANAQTVPVGQGVTATAQNYGQPDLVANNYVADEVVNAVSLLPLQNTYYRAGRGFISARVDQTGENVGVEYQLNGNTKTPVRAYNLDDPQGAANFRNAVGNAGATENQLAINETRSRIYASSYPTYVYARPVQPVILIGPLFRPWISNNSYHRHDYRHHGWQQPPRYIPPPQIVIRIGGNDHRGNDHYRGNDRGRDNHRDNNRGGRDNNRGPGGHHR